MRPKKHRDDLPAGFTIIELLVVVGIIGLVLGTSLAFFSTLRSNTIKQSAQLVRITFIKANQYACSQRIIFFIVFDTKQGLMSIYEDTDGNEEFNKGDIQVGETVSLLKGVFFSDKPTLFQLPQPYVGFRTNGSLILPAEVKDAQLNPPSEADIILEHKTENFKMYLDFVITTGRIRQMVYREE
jgi:prepilin-type N-terminal cleavage/methylation domain-containing protein